MNLQLEESVKTITFSVQGYEGFYVDITFKEKEGMAYFYLYNTTYCKDFLTKAKGSIGNIPELILAAQSHLESADYIGAYRDEFMN